MACCACATLTRAKLISRQRRAMPGECVHSPSRILDVHPVGHCTAVLQHIFLPFKCLLKIIMLTGCSRIGCDLSISSSYRDMALLQEGF